MQDFFSELELMLTSTTRWEGGADQNISGNKMTLEK